MTRTVKATDGVGESRTKEDPMTQGVELHLRCRVIPARQTEFLSLLREAVPFYESPGGIRVRLQQDAHDADRFIEVVEYRDEAVYQQDQARVENDSVMKSYLDRWRLLLAEPPVVEVYRRVSI